MSFPLDTEFGDGTTEQILVKLTLDDQVPSLVQCKDQQKILLLFIWEFASQILVLNLETMHGSWGVGVCATAKGEQQPINLTAKIAAALLVAFVDLGFQTVSALAFGEMQQFLKAEGMQEQQENLLTADITDVTFLQEYRPNA